MDKARKAIAAYFESQHDLEGVRLATLLVFLAEKVGLSLDDWAVKLRGHAPGSTSFTVTPRGYQWCYSAPVFYVDDECVRGVFADWVRSVPEYASCKDDLVQLTLCLLSYGPRLTPVQPAVETKLSVTDQLMDVLEGTDGFLDALADRIADRLGIN